MADETKKRIDDLAAQLTPRGAFEAAHWGNQFPEGARFLKAYNEIRELESDQLKAA